MERGKLRFCVRGAPPLPELRTLVIVFMLFSVMSLTACTGQSPGSQPLGAHTTASLVLGSGGARGFAHIGVLQWLVEKGYANRSSESWRASEMIALGRMLTAEAFARAGRPERLDGTTAQ